MIIGVPKEIKNNENRVAVTPAGASEFVKHGHTVYVQKTAGLGSGFTDEQYTQGGATLLDTIEEVYAIASENPTYRVCLLGDRYFKTWDDSNPKGLCNRLL